jgi:hypothetical protein
MQNEWEDHMLHPLRDLWYDPAAIWHMRKCAAPKMCHYDIKTKTECVCRFESYVDILLHLKFIIFTLFNENILIN